jgi:eukaryotic-like serine/threonine-protein kinase
MGIEPGTDVGGRYHIVEQLGEGGMAVVYRAYDRRLDCDVALKLIRADEFGPAALERLLKRFEREAKSLAKLVHPNIVPISDYGEESGVPYLVMQYLEGGSLRERTGKPCPYNDAAALLAPVARALAYAHERKVIHRDIKPGNILITRSGEPMLSDFGIAKLLEEGSTQITSAGMGVGTPDYMAPEQWEGQVSAQTDIYALGVVLYELVTGRKPYIADTPVAMMRKHILDPLPRPREINPDLPEPVERVLFKALAKDPNERYEDMGVFAKALEGLSAINIQPSAISGQPEKPVGAGLSSPVMSHPDTEKPPVAIRKSPRPMPEKTKPKPHPGATYETLPEDIGARDVGANGRSPLRGFPGWIWAAGGAALLAVIGIIIIMVGLGDREGSPSGDVISLLTKRTPPYAETPVQTLTLTPEPGIGSTQVSPQDGMLLIYVPEGNFEMGSAEGSSDEQPVHTVYLDAFWIDQTEVTNGMYALCVEAGICEPSKNDKYYGDPNYDDYPVRYATWDRAATYCQWAGRRLPSEAEWEKAACGPEDNLYPLGENISCSLANYRDQNGACVGDISAVGSYPEGASSYGAFDMAGNVEEWVMDWYDDAYYSQSPGSNPTGPSSGEYRVLRGGSFDFGISRLRSANRNEGSPSFSGSDSGFRCAISTDASQLEQVNHTVTPTASPISIQTSATMLTLSPTVTSTPGATVNPEFHKTVVARLSTNPVVIVYENDFNDNKQGWSSEETGSYLKIESGILKVIGHYIRAYRLSDLPSNGGALGYFTFTQGSKFKIFSSTRSWNGSEGYLSTGVFYDNGAISVFSEDGTDFRNLGDPEGDLTLTPKTWYYILFHHQSPDQISVKIWDPNHPDSVLSYQWTSRESWRDQTWQMQFKSEIGALYLDHYLEYQEQ